MQIDITCSECGDRLEVGIIDGFILASPCPCQVYKHDTVTVSDIIDYYIGIPLECKYQRMDGVTKWYIGYFTVTGSQATLFFYDAEAEIPKHFIEQGIRAIKVGKFEYRVEG